MAFTCVGIRGTAGASVSATARDGSRSGSVLADGTAAIGDRSAIDRTIEAMPAAGITATAEVSAPATPLDGSTAATEPRISTAETTYRAPPLRIGPASKTVRRPREHVRRPTARTTCTPIGQAMCTSERKTVSGNSAPEVRRATPHPSSTATIRRGNEEPRAPKATAAEPGAAVAAGASVENWRPSCSQTPSGLPYPNY